MRTNNSIIQWAALCSLAALPLQLTAASLGTAFSYQGRLSDANGSVTGLYDFTFTLWDASAAGNQLGKTFINSATALGVTNGLFTTSLDFGTCILSDQVCWLEITVCTNLDQAHKHTLPRQQLMPAPQSLYAQKAGTAADGGVSVTSINTSGAPTAGQVLTYNGSQLAWTTPNGGGSGAWSVSGNNSTTSANFVGTTDPQPLELRVNNIPAMRLEPATIPNLIVNPATNSVATDGSVFGSSIGGGNQNQVQRGAFYSVIAGGQQNRVGLNAYHSVVMGGLQNSAAAPGATVGGGEGNVASGIGAVVAGGGADADPFGTALGKGNHASGAASTVGGGVDNLAAASYTTVGGGIYNAATNSYATVGGGAYNAAGATSATVSGGYLNTANGPNSAIPGGYNNRASGECSFAAGQQAQALHDGCFVWADSQGGPLASTANNQFLIRAAGGVHVQGVVTAQGFGGNWQVVAANVWAEPGRAYLVNSPGQVMVILPPAAAIGDSVRLCGAGTGGWRLVPNTGQRIQTANLGANGIGTVWTFHGSSLAWHGVASSADGTKLVAVVYGGQIYTSTDSGVTWSPRESTRNWSAVASSANGTKLAAVVDGNDGGQIYTSIDSGVSWIPRETNRRWTAVASSADGTKLVAAAFSGTGDHLFTSTDSGATWTPRITENGLSAVASSADGTTLLAAAWGLPGLVGDYLYTSYDSGVNWDSRMDSHSWDAVACSADGQKMVAAIWGGQVYTSGDKGINWTAHENNRNWSALASSADGTRLAAVTSGAGGQIYISNDSGQTWIEQGIMTGPSYSGVACSADGTKFVVVQNGGQICTSTAATTTGTAGGLLGSQYAAVELLYIGNGDWLPVSYVGTLTPN